MRNRPETIHEYNIPRLHWWFFVSSALLLGSLLLMIWVDYSGGEIRWLGLRGDREWKPYQQQFFELEKIRLAGDARAAELRANEAGLERFRKELVAARQELQARQQEEAAVRAQAERIRVEAALVTREFTMAKATRDEVRSFYEAALERNALNMDAPEVRRWLTRVTQQNRVVDELELQKQEVDLRLEAAEAKLEEIIGRERELERNIKRFEDGIKLLEDRLVELTDPLIRAVVTMPLLEFAASPFRVEQVVAENHHVDVNFTTVPRVDRCMTCHKAIDRADSAPEELEWRAKHNIESVQWSQLHNPLKNHPRLDLFVGDTSPHPMSTYGCTVCHWGWDRETTFSRAGHTPDTAQQRAYVLDEKTRKWIEVKLAGNAGQDAAPAAAADNVVSMTQKEAWIKNYHWEHQEFLLQPMRQQKYIQASCLKCHSGQTELEGAPMLSHGRRLIEQLGCWSCHKMEQLETYSVHRVAPGEDFDSICNFYDVNPAQVRHLNNLPPNAQLTVGRELSIPIRTLQKPGPSLDQLAAKSDPEWVRKWLADPIALRPNTYMPKFWGLINNTDPDRDAVEINAITEFLFAISRRPSLPPPPVPGNAENGRVLVQQLGCMGCHVIDEKLTDMRPPAELRPYMDDWDYRRFRSQGPALAGTGSKTDVNWLYAWLKNPRDHHPGTKMPNLRLSDQEAADLAVYLAGLRDQAADAMTLPDMTAAERQIKLRDVALEYLQVLLPRRQAEEKLNNLDDLIEMYFADPDTLRYYRDPALLAREQARHAELQKEFEETFDDAIQRQAAALADQINRVKDGIQAARQRVAALDELQKRNVYLGSRLVSHYGCFACHDIRGFEHAKPIGTELSRWGSKPLEQLDFGLLHIEHDRVAFLRQKLQEPRAFDLGRIGVTRAPQELLKMPKFSLTEEQIDQIVTVVTGMTSERLTPNEPRHLTPAEFQIERGRWMVKELNCQGCHLIENKGWAIRATDIPAGMEPPMISGTPTQLRQGQRTQPEWLFHFLKNPQTGEVRPWLKARMPTYDLTDAEANVLVRYFALEGRTRFPYETPQVITTPEHLAAGKQLFDQLRCALCHIVEGMALGKPLDEIPEEDLPRLAPDMNLAHKRLQRDWLINKWLPEPLAQVPGTRMPQFEYGHAVAPHILGGDTRKQLEALTDYILSLGAPSAAPAQTAAAEPTGPAKD
jgi:mono/diheme cytochrome c family protein